MTWRVGVSGGFSAAHFHAGAGEECARVHGHNYRVEAVVEGDRAEQGMLMDFRVLRRALREAASGWDHRILNETDDFIELLPTAENIARRIFEKIDPAAAGPGARLLEVKVWEKEDCWASYRPGGEL